MIAKKNPVTIIIPSLFVFVLFLFMYLILNAVEGLIAEKYFSRQYPLESGSVGSLRQEFETFNTRKIPA